MHESYASLSTDMIWVLYEIQSGTLPDSYGDTLGVAGLCPGLAVGAGVCRGKRDQASANRLLGPVAQVTDARLPAAVYQRSMGLPTPGAVDHLWGMVPSTPPRDVWRSSQTTSAPACRSLICPTDQAAPPGRVIPVRTQVVFGAPAVVTARLAQSPVSKTINTSFVERDNLTQRQQNRRLTGGPMAFQGHRLAGKTGVVVLGVLPFDLAPCPVADPFANSRTHARHRFPSTMAAPDPGDGGRITDHLWTVRELLSYRVSPLYWQEQPLLEKLFPSWPEIDHGS